MAINMVVRTEKQAEKVKREARYLKSSIAPLGGSNLQINKMLTSRVLNFCLLFDVRLILL